MNRRLLSDDASPLIMLAFTTLPLCTRVSTERRFTLVVCTNDWKENGIVGSITTSGYPFQSHSPLLLFTTSHNGRFDRAPVR